MRYLVLLIITLTFASCKQEKVRPQLIKLSGPVFGTGFNIQYASNTDGNYMVQIDSLFKVVNQSLSTYIPNSDISRLNRGDTVVLDHHFKRVFKASKAVYKATEGAFDPTIGNVVNAWSFGADKDRFLTDSTTIDSLMQFVGLNRMGLLGNTLQKPFGSYIEFNAIAKGYAVDRIAEFLEKNNVSHYLVEIGGEVRVKGKNIEKQLPWRVGLDEPRFDGQQSIYKSISLIDEAMATSGTYRKFKIDSAGHRYAHIINTKTGYPTKTNILSVSVIAKDCMTADAFATAFQAMGVDRVKTFLKGHPELKVYVIYYGTDNMMKTLNLNQFPE